MISKMTSVVVAGIAAVGLIAALPHDAQARDGRKVGFGIAAGVLGGAIIGGYAYGRAQGYGAGDSVADDRNYRPYHTRTYSSGFNGYGPGGYGLPFSRDNGSW